MVGEGVALVENVFVNVGVGLPVIEGVFVTIAANGDIADSGVEAGSPLQAVNARQKMTRGKRMYLMGASSCGYCTTKKTLG